MLFERAEILIKDDLGAEFVAAMNEFGLPTLRAVPGVQSAQMGRGVENPSKFMLLVEWKSMDDHTAFRKSSTYQPFLKIIGPYSKGGSMKGGSMEHFEMA